MHGLRVFDQTDGGGELRIFERRGQSRHCLRVRDVRRHFKDFSREMIDPVEQAASAGDENARADVIDERFLFDCAFEQLEAFRADAR